jgi:hypothetical protein
MIVKINFHKFLTLQLLFSAYSCSLRVQEYHKVKHVAYLQILHSHIYVCIRPITAHSVGYANT